LVLDDGRLLRIPAAVVMKRLISLLVRITHDMMALTFQSSTTVRALNLVATTVTYRQSMECRNVPLCVGMWQVMT
jgi:hypothetical protein